MLSGTLNSLSQPVDLAIFVVLCEPSKFERFGAAAFQITEIYARLIYCSNNDIINCCCTKLEVFREDAPHAVSVLHLLSW